IQMSLYSIPFYATFEERTGDTAGYRPQGYLFLATSDGQLQQLQANQVRQKALGLKDAEMLSADDIRNSFPLVRTDDVVGGSFCPTDGFVDPNSAMVGFTKAACTRGTRVMKSAEVLGIETDARGVCGVRTAKGEIATRVVVN